MFSSTRVDGLTGEVACFLCKHFPIFFLHFQHALVLPVLFGHLRFHECLGKFEEKIGHEFRDRYLLQVRCQIGLTLCILMDFPIYIDLGPSINGLVTDGKTKLCCRGFILVLFQSTRANKIDSEHTGGYKRLLSVCEAEI